MAEGERSRMDGARGAGQVSDILHCAKCKQPLKIVCDAHGTEFVPDRVTELPPLRKDRPLKAKPAPVIIPPPRRRAARREHVRAQPSQPTQVSRILAMLSTDVDRPSSVADVVAAVGSDVKRMGIYLCILAKEGRIMRASAGKYFRQP